MKLSPIAFYMLAAVCQTAGSSGAAMLAPFFMKEHGYSIALAGIPLVANGIGRVCSDLLSGAMATYFSSGVLLIAAVVIGFTTSVLGYLFVDVMPVFLTAWTIFGLTEAMYRDPRFTRLSWLERLIAERRLDGTLRWTHEEEPG